MRIVGCSAELNLAQLQLVRQWMAERRLLTIDLRREPFLRRKVEQLARHQTRIAPEPGRGWRA